MPTLPDAMGPAAILAASTVLEIRLNSRPDTAPLSVPIAAAKRNLRSKKDAFDEARAVAIAATGLIAFADSVEDDGLGDVARHARVITGGDLSHPLWVSLFGNHRPSVVTAGIATEEQAALARHVMAVIASDAAFALLLPLLPTMSAARADVLASQEARRVAVEAQTTASNALQIAAAAARDAYRDVEPLLMLRFPGKKLLVRSFFVSKAKKKKAKAESEEE